MNPAQFYTGLVVDAYAKLKSAHFDAAPYAGFISRTGEPALELGCGDGEPLLSLVAQGFAVSGVDSSADMLARCRANAAARGVEVTLHHQPMESLSLPGRYRSIFLAGPTFNLLPDDETALRALNAIRAHLTDDGAALIPLWIPDPSTDLGVPREAEGDDGSLLRYTPLSETYDPVARTRVTTSRYERLTATGSETAGREWILHWHTPAQFRALCAEAALTVTALLDDNGDPAPSGATDFTAVVRP
ncbi:class I SAM-dependent methyltransferase [Actinoplanes sp. NPDC048796]|uniref:class I SAM-dependent methyltransferase n=1 Tax=Actinoplanes sp. NPDC048796 TaxID=3155640 RepID=UPI0034021C73